MLKKGVDACPVRRVAAGEIDAAVVDQVRALIQAPEVVAATWKAAARTAGETGDIVTETEAREALQRLDPLWDELFPAEQARILQLLVERVEVGVGGVTVRLRSDGLATLVADLRARDSDGRAAA